MIFDGLVVESAPAVNAGASEHNLLYGGDRVEINSVNLYATVAAKSLRGDLDIVRGLKAGLPAGVDLSKAKAWVSFSASGPVIHSSYNIKSVTRSAAGTFEVTFGTPFKPMVYQSGRAVCAYTAEQVSSYDEQCHAAFNTSGTCSLFRFNGSGTGKDSTTNMAVFFGELENE